MLLNPYFGQYGGQFVPELLLPALDQLERAYVDATDDPAFRTPADDLCGPSDAAHEAHAPYGGHEDDDLPQARGSQPHRRT